LLSDVVAALVAPGEALRIPGGTYLFFFFFFCYEKVQNKNKRDLFTFGVRELQPLLVRPWRPFQNSAATAAEPRTCRVKQISKKQPFFDKENIKIRTFAKQSSLLLKHKESSDVVNFRHDKKSSDSM
jgi:hypothetical protein